MKIRCSDNLGVNLDQVVAWEKGKIDKSGEKREFLSLYFAGADDALYVYQDSVGCQAFAYLHKLLLDRFAIDLAGDNNPLAKKKMATAQ